MKPLEIFCRNRVLYVRISVQYKGTGMKDYYLYHKDGTNYFIFRKSQGIWKLTYGQLPSDVCNACIDALILRFDQDVPDLFYHKGVRQVVHISAKKYSVWHIYLNNGYVGSIQYDPFTKKFHYYLDEKTLLTEEHIQKYITMIQHGEISWRKGEGR